MINTVFFDCNKRLYFWIWFKFPWRVLSAQPSPFQALITITKTAENSGARKWKYFHFWIQLSKSFCSSLPCFLCSSAALESLHTEAKASSLVVCQSSHLTLLPWATSWPPAGGEAAEFSRNRWCRPTPPEQGNLLIHPYISGRRQILRC